MFERQQSEVEPPQRQPRKVQAKVGPPVLEAEPTDADVAELANATLDGPELPPRPSYETLPSAARGRVIDVPPPRQGTALHRRKRV